MGLGLGALLIFSFKADETEILNWTKMHHANSYNGNNRMGMCAKGSAKPFSPGNNPITHAIKMRVRLRGCVTSQG